MSPCLLQCKENQPPSPREETEDVRMYSPTADQSEHTTVIIICETQCSDSVPHAFDPHRHNFRATPPKASIQEREVNFCHLYFSCSARIEVSQYLRPDSRAAPFLFLGDFKHAKALVLLQQFIFGPDLLPQALQLLLLLLWAHTDAGHGADQLPNLLEFVLELIQHLVNILAVLVHAAEERKARHH